MKQHITPKQLNELSKKGKERLREWWKPKDGDLVLVKKIKIDGESLVESKKSTIFSVGYEICFSQKNGFIIYSGYDDNRYIGKEQSLPLLSIGQMIEFLEEKKGAVDISNANGDWIVGRTDHGEFIEEESKRNNEICDALFEAVKEVLEK